MSKELSNEKKISALLDFYAEDLALSRVHGLTGASFSEEGPVAAAKRLSLNLYGPEYALVWGGHLAFSQLDVYRPYLQRTRKKPIIFAKSLKNAKQEDLNLDIPFYDHAEGFSTHDNLSSISSLQTALYISDKPENFSYIRRNPQMIHVFSGHGDSDKHSSASRVATVYDYVMSADRNAMERFVTANIQLSPDRFVLIGGSPIEGVEVGKQKSAFKNILYAPTWEGYSQVTNFSSAGFMMPELEKLNAAGFKVRFRPHPALGKKQEGLKSAKAYILGLFGKSDTKADDFNWSDLIVTDISGVLSEYLFTGNPIIIPVREEWLKEYLSKTTIPEYAYIWDTAEMPLESFIGKISDDPLRKKRQNRRDALYLGAQSVDDLCEMFNDTLDMLSLVQAERQKKALNYSCRKTKEAKLFSKTPQDRALADLVEQVRAGKLVLKYPVQA